mmetsp:Transcript_11980/g.28076  ORF Transcript_11980/g.28076 Transcript_11980/m.28076 type:complete len:476 (-) Transcript_11980:13-1440(-)
MLRQSQSPLTSRRLEQEACHTSSKDAPCSRRLGQPVGRIPLEIASSWRGAPVDAFGPAMATAAPRTARAELVQQRRVKFLHRWWAPAWILEVGVRAVVCGVEWRIYRDGHSSVQEVLKVHDGHAETCSILLELRIVLARLEPVLPLGVHPELQVLGTAKAQGVEEPKDGLHRNAGVVQRSREEHRWPRSPVGLAEPTLKRDGRVHEEGPVNVEANVVDPIDARVTTNLVAEEGDHSFRTGTDAEDAYAVRADAPAGMLRAQEAHRPLEVHVVYCVALQPVPSWHAILQHKHADAFVQKSGQTTPLCCLADAEVVVTTSGKRKHRRIRTPLSVQGNGNGDELRYADIVVERPWVAALPSTHEMDKVVGISSVVALVLAERKRELMPRNAPLGVDVHRRQRPYVSPERHLINVLLISTTWLACSPLVTSTARQPLLALLLCQVRVEQHVRRRGQQEAEEKPQHCFACRGCSKRKSVG